MSRGRDSERTDRAELTPDDRVVDARDWSTSITRRHSPAGAHRDLAIERSRRLEFAMDRLALPRGETLKTVDGRDRAYRIRGSETAVLATVGAFRVVREDDLAAARLDDHVRRDVDHLKDQGLVDHRTVAINREPTRVVALTEAGRSLLEDHREAAPDRCEQTFHSGWANRSDLPHDAQIYRLFQLTAPEIEAEGGRIRRVVLDPEFKGNYFSYLERGELPGALGGVVREHRMETFGRASHLPVIDGHLQVPDLRVEYERQGRLERRDVELVTECYSRGHVATRFQAGFTVYRAVVHGAAAR